MKRIVTPWAPFLYCLCTAGILHAGVIANSSLTLTQFQILPSSGSVQFLSPITATAFAQALDSLGGLDQHFNSIDDGATSAAALSALAGATAGASATAFTGSAISSVGIPGIESIGSSTAQASLSGSFEIVGPSSPVAVQFSAMLGLAQTLSTLDGGLSASSELSFSLTLDDGDQPLFFDNILPVPPDSTSSSSSTDPMNGSATLDPNVPFTFTLSLDSETRGQDSPEPAAILLSAAGLAAVFVRRRRCRQG